MKILILKICLGDLEKLNEPILLLDSNDVDIQALK